MLARVHVGVLASVGGISRHLAAPLFRDCCPRSRSVIRRHPANPLPGVVVAVSAFLYALLVVKGKRVDRRERRKSGCIFLPEHVLPGRQLYAVVVDTGFRAPARFTAKVPEKDQPVGDMGLRCPSPAWSPRGLRALVPPLGRGGRTVPQ